MPEPSDASDRFGSAAGCGEEPHLAPVIPLHPVAVGAADPLPLVDVYESEHLDLFRFIRGVVRDQEVAEDILQETFLRLIRESAAGRRPANIHGWLYRVATNLSISAARRTQTAIRYLPRLTGLRPAASPEQWVLDSERDAALRGALEALTPDARVALLLSANGFSAREIGSSLGRSEAAIRTLLCRARVRLRERLTVQDRPSSVEVG